LPSIPRGGGSLTAGALIGASAWVVRATRGHYASMVRLVSQRAYVTALDTVRQSTGCASRAPITH
jgi:hypothetical protein